MTKSEFETHFSWDGSRSLDSKARRELFAEIFAVAAVTATWSRGMRSLTIFLALLPLAARAGTFDLSLSSGTSWPLSGICADYNCPVAPQVAVRLGYSPSFFGKVTPLSLGVRGELNAGPDGGGPRARSPSNNSRALLVEALVHSLEIGAAYGDTLFVVEASLGVRVVLGVLQLGVEGRYTGWPTALRDYDSYNGFTPSHREATSSFSAAAVVGVSL